MKKTGRMGERENGRGGSVSSAQPVEANHQSALLEVLERYWGYDQFRPLQQQAMNRVLDGLDSVVVLPTGGGKSLCYQAPAICMGGLAVVVSPLISLMKDQVDALRTNGVPAACINSAQTKNEKRNVAEDIRAGRLRLLYAAPERLVQPQTLEFLKSAGLSFVAIDEAHCISEWGHDFRPEYRELSILRKAFPNIGIHAYTATATDRVRRDIAQNLGLRNPELLVGSFDRPNLIYRVERRQDRSAQIRDVLNRHRGDSGIIYCISRKNVDTLSESLNADGYKTLPYHAGLADEERKRNQEAFIEEKVETIVATVAFGMGIDKSNVRYVIHAGMPKSLENYQQESGRAGRDGLEAECCLFYSASDPRIWKKLTEEDAPQSRAASLRSLEAIDSFCTGIVCRHRRLVEHFGQTWDRESCSACDVCLGQLDLMDDALIVGQKILSSIVRQQQRFGGDYTAQVLKGSKIQRILENKHDQISTFGILKEHDKQAIRDWIEQLASQGFLEEEGEYNVLKVTAAGRKLLKGEVTPRLLKPRKLAPKKAAAVETDAWEGVDRGLFEMLRKLRRKEAEKRGISTYIVFSDAALREMARRRPSTLEAFRTIRGVGEKKLDDYGEVFVQNLVNYCALHRLAMDVRPR